MRWIGLAIGAPLFMAALALLAWAFVLYPDPADPKNMRYVLWKHNLASMDLDVATYTIEEDPAGKQALILGRSEKESATVLVSCSRRTKPAQLWRIASKPPGQTQRMQC